MGEKCILFYIPFIKRYMSVPSPLLSSPRTHFTHYQGLHELAVDYDICSKAFGISSDQVDYQIQQTLSRYGGDKIASSRIIFPNGQIDPWRANGVNTSPNDEEPVFLVPGASHHFWTHPSLPTDSVEVNNAREKIWKQVTLSHV